MIWPNQIHQKRPIRAWLSNKECSFSNVVLDLLERTYEPVLFPNPVVFVRQKPLIFIQNLTDLGKVIKLIQYFAPYCDSAFWINGRGIKDTIRRTPISSWMDMLMRQAYAQCDILVIDDIPRKDRDDPNYIDGYEIDQIIKERLALPNKLTILLGENAELLSSVIRYTELRNLQEGMK